MGCACTKAGDPAGERDAITLVDFFHSAVTDYPVFGLNVADTM